ncbi:MAG: phosphate signaling complex protein PhoU [Pseudomonadota bacterium]
MENNKIRHHISQQFNQELEDMRNKVLAMGGLVERQIEDAVKALASGDMELADNVISQDHIVNGMEVAMDEECTRILARRQPAAFDLRLLIAVIKTITDLERIGDQAERVARMAIRMADLGRPKTHYTELQHLGNLVREILHKALDTFARMDAEGAAAVARLDLDADHEYDSVMRQMITHMMEDPRNVRYTLNIIWAARALERIGDHARNICEYVIYFVKGKDVRHTSFDEMEKEAKE